MSADTLLSLLVPMLAIWVIYRVGKRAVGPLLADARVARLPHLQLHRPAPRNLSSQLALDNDQPRPFRQALVVALFVAATYFGLMAGNIAYAVGTPEWMFSDTFAYVYYPRYDFAVDAGLIFGFLLFSRVSLKTAFFLFVALTAAMFAFDVAYNFIGSRFFETNLDMYAGGSLGYFLQAPYYAGSVVVCLAVLGLFFPSFKEATVWISTLFVVMLCVVLAIPDGPVTAVLGALELQDFSFLVPSVGMAGAIGYWLPAAGHS